MDRALYGSNGFYRRHAPGAHFRTSVHASESFATAIAGLVDAVGATEVVDVGAGRGELLTALADRMPYVALYGVEVAARPQLLPDRIGWSEIAPSEGDGVRLLLANEWLDNVPLDVVEVDVEGAVRLMFVAPDGFERAGDPPTSADLAWLRTWWPIEGADPGTRAEIGWPRDLAWSAAVRSVRRGLAVAVDYAHRAGERPLRGTLAGYRDGRQVPPEPDGSCDLTAHVALDACAAAGVEAGGTATALASQRAVLDALGVGAALPPRDRATTDPDVYLTELAAATGRAELRDPDGLGGFHWLIQAVGVDLPPALAPLAWR
jgi:SAM-dependent MidA family methyltransferase